MTYEQWYAMTRLMLNFMSLSQEDQERILLMIDGFRFRAIEPKEAESE